MRKKILKIILTLIFTVSFCCFGKGSGARDVDQEIEEALDAYEKVLDVPSWPDPGSGPATRNPSPVNSRGAALPEDSGFDAVSPTATSGGMENISSSAASRNSQDLLDSAVIDILSLKNMDIIDVLKLISEKSDLNIIAGKDIQGKVSIYLKDVKVKDALRIILDANGMSYRMEDGIVHVMPASEYESRYGIKFGGDIETYIYHLKHADINDAVTLLGQVKSSGGKIVSDPKSRTLVLMDTPEKLGIMEHLIRKIDVPIHTEIFDLNYAKAQEVADKIREALTPNLGEVKFDERSNRLVVTEAEARMGKIARMIRAFDVKEKQVLIEAKIVQVVLSNQHKFGIDWEGLIQNYHNLDLKSSFDILTSTSKGGSLGIGTISADQYNLLIEALESVGVSNILSSPSITAINNQEAKILVGSTEPYVTTTTTTTAAGPTTTAESVNFIEVGVKLYVTPTIHKDGFITMKIRPEVSSVTSTITTGNNNTIPVVDTSEAETTVMVKDGVTIVIGGLIKEEDIDSLNKVPLLGDIPLVGYAFRNKDRLVRKTEIVIFLTPKIITGDIPS